MRTKIDRTKCNTSAGYLALAAAVATLGLTATTAGAGTVNFIGDGTSTGGGYQHTQWPDLNNWQGGVLPGPNDTAAFIDKSNGNTTWSGVSLYGNRTVGAIDIVVGGDWNIDPGSPGTSTLTLTTGNIIKRTTGNQGIGANLIIDQDGLWQNLSGLNYTGALVISGQVTGSGSVTMTGPGGWDQQSIIRLANNGSINVPSLTVLPRMMLQVDGSTSVNRLADTMPIALQSAWMKVTAVSNTNTSEDIGNLTTSGLSVMMPTASGTGSMTVTTPNLLRANNGSLMLRPGGVLGSAAIFKVTAGVTTSNGMAAPWILQQAKQDLYGNTSDTNFVNYDATNGFTPAVSTARTEADINIAASTEIVSLTKSVNDANHNPTLSGNLTLEALKLSGFNNTDIQGSGYTLTLTSGGLISMTGDVNVAPSLNFGSAEGAIYVTGPSYQSVSLDGPVVGSAGLTKSGIGAVTLNSLANTFTGPVTVNQGTLIIGGNSASGDGVGLNRTGTTLSLRIARPGSLNLNNRTQRIASLDGEGTIYGGGTLTIILPNSVTATFSGVISSAANINVQGQGRQIFDGNNTYTGTTTVSGGTLVVNGATTGQGAYNVTGGILGGNGTIGLASGKSVTIASTGHLAPGNSIGTLTITGDAALQSGGAFDFELGNAGSADLLNVANLTLAGDLNLTQMTGTSASGTYILANYTGALSGTFANVSGIPSGYQLNYGTRSNSQITLTAVPEPASVISLMGIGGLALLRRRRGTVV